MAFSSLFNDINSSDDDSGDADYNPEETCVLSDEAAIPFKDENRKAKKSKKQVFLPLKNAGESEKSETSSVYDKTKADCLFKNFLAEVAKEKNKSYFSESITNSSSTLSELSTKVNSSNSLQGTSPKMSNELLEFTGETISVDKNFFDTTFNKSKCAVMKKKGLSNVIDIIQKKPKITILQKSQLDWKMFKKEQGIGDELKQYNLGKGFIERKRFLEKCDYKSYEIERDMRLKKRKA